jgi:beta-N-acetylhexosaminidase
VHENDLGQLLIVTLSELRWASSLEHNLRRLSPGGVLIDAPLPNGADALREFLSKLACTVPTVPFLALREEGGRMDPLRSFLPPLPSPRAATGKGVAAVERLGELVGAGLELLGFNTNFAPLLDLGLYAGNESRAFSTDPQQVAKFGGTFLEGLDAHEVRACGKHFPGLGGAPTAKPSELPVVSKPMAELWREDLVPYRALLPRLPLLLVSSAAYKAYDFDLLQSAGLSSKVVEGLLRVKLGYDGVAIANGLETEAVRGALALEEAAVQAVGAGCDMLLLEEPQAAERAQAALSAALQSGKLLRPRVAQALQRIQLVKRGLRPPDDKLSRGSLDKLIRQFTIFSAAFASSEKS